MKSIADIKRTLQRGTRVQKIHHMEKYVGRDENNKAIWEPGDPVNGVVVECRTNSLLFRWDDRPNLLSHLPLPKRSEVEFHPDGFTVLERDMRLFGGGLVTDETTAHLPVIPVLTYRVIGGQS